MPHGLITALRAGAAALRQIGSVSVTPSEHSESTPEERSAQEIQQDADLYRDSVDRWVERTPELPTPATGLRERIIAKGEAQFQAHDEYCGGIPSIALAAASEALRIAQERIQIREEYGEQRDVWQKGFNTGCFDARMNVIDVMLTELASSPDAQEKK